MTCDTSVGVESPDLGCDACTQPAGVEAPELMLDNTGGDGMVPACAKSNPG